MTLPPRRIWAPAGNANALARVLTAAVLIPAVVALVLWGSAGVVAAGTALAMLLALLEFFSLAQRVGLQAYRLWTALCALGVLFQQWLAADSRSWNLAGGLRLTRAPARPELPLEIIFFVFILGAAVLVFASRRPLAGVLGDLGISAAGLIFIALPLSAVVRLDALGVIGPKLLLFTLVLVWTGDTLAYVAGRWFGRMRMAPQLSPGKTWEGAAANLLGSVIVGVIFASWLHVEPLHMVLMAALANLAGQAGDLMKSAYKRAAGVKDSGTLLPGHGGMLDRIDALIFAAPVVWYYFEFVISRS
jgi:phosphatidate cytidylyltransferase